MRLTVFNLNIMHARNRKSALFPPCLSRAEVERNLEAIAEEIDGESSDIVTLQEIDEYSVLSGRFDQFTRLREKLGYPYAYFAPSCSLKLCNMRLYISGTAIFSRYPLNRAESHRFHISFPNDRMGFALADIVLPNGSLVVVASIHTVAHDWSRLRPRASNMRDIVAALSARGRHFVLAGDFNCDMMGSEYSLQLLVTELSARVYSPQSQSLATYPSWEPSRRIDWILLSPTLRFESYRNLTCVISDHLAQCVELSL